MSDEQRIITVAIHLAYGLRELAAGDLFSAGKSSSLAWRNTWEFSSDELIDRSQQLCKALDKVARGQA